MNEFLRITCLLLIVVIPFMYRAWIAAQAEKPSPDKVNETFANSLVFTLGLYLFASFLPQKTSWVPGMMMLGAVIFSVMILISTRSQTRSNHQHQMIDPTERFYFAFRGLLSLLFKLAILQVSFMLFSPLLTPLGGALVGIGLMILCTPISVRISMPHARMHHSWLKQEILDLFDDHGHHLEEIYILNTQSVSISNALICGSKWGKGHFGRTLFLTETLFSEYQESEIKAILLHELAHLKLNHLSKRVLIGMTSIVLVGIAVFTPTSALLYLIREQKDYHHLILMTAFLAQVVLQLVFLFRYIRKQELEADEQAIKLGADPLALNSALEKLTRTNGTPVEKQGWLGTFFFSSTHPPLRVRQEAIAATLSLKSLAEASAKLTYLEGASLARKVS